LFQLVMAILYYIHSARKSLLNEDVRQQYRFFKVINLLSADTVTALGSTQPLTEMSTRNVSWRLKRPVPRVGKLTTFMCRVSRNVKASTSWNPQGLSRSIMGLLYFSQILSRITFFPYYTSVLSHTVICLKDTRT
jgi:hypothetical protein